MTINKALKRRSKKAGYPPGSLIYTGERENQKVTVSYLKLNHEKIDYIKDVDLEECFPLDPDSFHWLHVEGVHFTKYIQKLGAFLSIHPLVLEDILNIGQRPKVEEFEKYLFIVLRALNYNETQQQIEDDQASFILGSNFLISFLEKDQGIIKPIEERLLQGRGKTMRLGMDYLAYSLIDALVDQYFLVLDKIGDRIFFLENKIIKHPNGSVLQEINRLRRDMITLRRTVWPLREALGQLQRMESELIDDETMIYFKDIYDHTIQIMDTIESFRDIIAGMVYMHLSSATHKMNDIIKILTVVSTIFVPLTFITGVYGMNFDYMPELHHPLGYIITWAVMVAIAFSMIVFFWRKRWF